jgi:PKD repeat protein
VRRIIGGLGAALVALALVGGTAASASASTSSGRGPASPVAAAATVDAPSPAALGVDGLFLNFGSLPVGLICGVVTATYNYVLPGGHNTPNGLACQGYYVGPSECLNLLRWHDGAWFYSAVNVGRGQHFIHIDGRYIVEKRHVARPNC